MYVLVADLGVLLVRACAHLAEQQVRELVREGCFGCREPECAQNQMAHDCMYRPFEDYIDQYVTQYLSEALHQIPRRKMMEAFIKLAQEELTEEDNMDPNKQVGVLDMLAILKKIDDQLDSVCYDRYLQTEVAVEILKSNGVTGDKLQSLRFNYLGFPQKSLTGTKRKREDSSQSGSE